MAKITKWEPFKELEKIRREMDELMGGFFGYYPEERENVMWYPALDIEEKKADLMITVELPGMKKEDIKVTMHGDVLTISGERKFEKEEKDTHFHRIERSYGKFQRSIKLPVEVNIDKIEAKYKDGILHIKLPKSEKAKTKEISIDLK